MYNKRIEKQYESEVFINNIINNLLPGVIFKAIDIALKVNAEPLITRGEILKIIPRRTLEKAIVTGKLHKKRFGKKVYFSRLKFYEFIYQTPKIKRHDTKQRTPN